MTDALLIFVAEHWKLVSCFVAVAVGVLDGVEVLVGVFDGVSVKVSVTVGGSASGRS